MRTSFRLITGAVYNLLGRGWSIVLSLLATPYIVHQLGEREYGLFTLAGILGAYFSFLDVGVVMATQKFVAEKRTDPDRLELRRIVSASSVFYLGVAALGAALIVLLTPMLSVWLVKAGDANPATVRLVFRCAAVTFGLAMLEQVPQSTLKGLQKFGISNLLTSTFGTLRIVAALAVLHLGGRIGAVMEAQIAVQGVSVAVSYAVMLRMTGWAGAGGSWAPVLRKLMVFGLWSSVPSFIGPFLTHFEKLVVSKVWSVGALTYYSVPFNALSATWFLPQALTGVLFPAVSELDGQGRGERVRDLHARVGRHLVVYITPIIVLVASFASEILGWWMGGDFAARSSRVLVILACATLVNVSAWSSSTVLQAVNRPDLIAKAYLVEVVLYLPAAYGLVRLRGIEGAAWAYGGRVALDAAILWVLSCRQVRAPVLGFLGKVFGAGFLLALLAAAGFAALRRLMPHAGAVGEIAMATGFLALYSKIAWSMMLDETDRDALKSWLAEVARRGRAGGGEPPR